GLPASYTFTSSDGGVRSFTGTLMTPGTQAIDVADMVTSSLTGAEAGINVVSAVQASVAGPSSGVRGQTLTFTIGASEPGLLAGSVFSYSIQWGDGSPVQTIAGPMGTQVSHVFTTNGTYAIQVSATDSSGNSSNLVSQSVAITPVALQPDPANSSLT